MALNIYNTLTRKKEMFEPIDPPRVHLFVCGPTVYDNAHIGHGRTYVFFDFFARYLRHLGYDVQYLQNITDIDDKIIVRAQQERVDPLVLSKSHMSLYVRDMENLGITSVNNYALATEHITEMITQISALISKGYAYIENGSVYYEVSKFRDYGKLSGQNLDNLSSADRTEPNDEKRHPHDFALWKAYKDGEPFWESPFGRGRPGWHIEDTAITEKFFGSQYDIHGGGMDLIFPHHECEIAQQEAVSGISPLALYWMHVGFLKIKQEKMSKSLGNFITIREILASWSAPEFRLAMLKSHYRSPIDFEDSLLLEAREMLSYMKGTIRRIGREDNDGPRIEVVQEFTSGEISSFLEALDDDLNTPLALATLLGIFKSVNASLDHKKHVRLDKLLVFFRATDLLFGLQLFEEDMQIPVDIQKLIDQREIARKKEMWREADQFRKKILEAGYIVNDTGSGPVVSRKFESS